METNEIIMFCIKLVLGGIASFFAILLWSKTRDAAWMSLVASVLTSYTGTVFSMLCGLGIISAPGVRILGISIVSLTFEIIPSIFLILALILKIRRN